PCAWQSLPTWVRGPAAGPLPRDANQLVDDLDHVHREADGARLVGNGSGDGLANPPGGVGGKLVAAAVVELVHSLHQADVALLDQVQELQPARLAYFLVMETTRRRLASMSSCLACSLSISPWIISRWLRC